MNDNPVLISLHPKHAQKILLGEKRLEFRRVWAKKPVSQIVIYSTAPVQRIVAIATVKNVHSGSATKLWDLCKSIGGGISRRDLYTYFRGKKTGFAVEIGDVIPLVPCVNPNEVLTGFVPPQSFQYLSPEVVSSILRHNQKKLGRVIFVGGVHGVGKTTLCKRIAFETGVLHKSAGELIRDAEPDVQSVRTKAVLDPERNQKILIEQVSKIISSGATLLLDGHFTLLKPNGSIEALPVEVFSQLRVEEILLLSDDATEILKRRNARDEQKEKLENIMSHQEREIVSAEEVSKQLRVRLHHFDFPFSENDERMLQIQSFLL